MLTRKRIYHLLIRVFVALLASHFVVVHGTKKSWLELFNKGYYYASLFYSMLIAYLLIEYIYMVSRIINKVFDEHGSAAKRLKYQFIFGFFFASVNAFLLAMILFWIKDENIFTSGYFKNLFVYILLFIFTINVVYLLYYEYVKVPKIRYQMIEIDPAMMGSLRSSALEANLPAIIYHENKICFAVDFNGVKTIWPHTIAESMGFLNPADYFQINRKDIVHRAAIVSFSSYQLRFLKIAHCIPSAKELITSRRKSVIFKEWLSG
ncbi:hypothetical protein [Pedobacter insulae]|uniref:LytTr DNA-binding domain-containing protein n=1 Tax=Pedobacter insulae TaxID=414048 RepID=A0A1I2Y0W0_9SPHI|nr:hypothetical protein [Pedobacter insulae]SFH19374.1 hypothetical protein SAMN04489864_106162 [Pedobacter insulae]